MECNRFDAEKCYGLAVEALRAKNISKAEKLLKKVQRMYPSKDAEGEFYHL